MADRKAEIERHRMGIQTILGAHIALILVLIGVGILMRKPDRPVTWNETASVITTIGALCALSAMAFSQKLLRVGQVEYVEDLPSVSSWTSRALVVSTVADLASLLGLLVAVVNSHIGGQLVLTGLAILPYVACIFPAAKRYFALLSSLPERTE